MKKTLPLLVFIAVSVLASCSKSYTYSGATLTVSTTFYRVSRSVSELGAHRLVWTTESEDATNRYALTETLTR
ncbi:MAG: hypothetical protein EOO61_21480 [Hymenobacter sp.]|nr:MAG: hypothetical protein EOO61_21480 [Hymenobacter sp.]